jgi:hypothetical protein
MMVRVWMAALFPAVLCAQSDGPADVARQIAEMNAVIQKLQHRVDDLEARLAPPPAAPPAPVPEQAAMPAVGPIATIEPADGTFLHGTTLNFLVDGYYGYNFNDPIGRVNRLRAFDVLSNSFSLNQADVVVENAPDVDRGKRWGVRLDLQFGQATETLQGNAANEPRPDIYRNVFQAYGTYIVPIGSGLTIDFGKWASSLGIENNYTQDQINYSRSFWFDFLPFYHMGARLNYQLSKQVAVNYWVTNGTQQTEPFNGFKDQFAGLTITPGKNLSWNVNYYLGQEHPDVMFLPNSTNPNLPTEQGEPFLPIQPAPKGKLHIFDSYATWQASPRLTLGLEGDYVIERLYTNSKPSEAWGGAGYARYQLSPRLAIGGRAEYLSDRGGLFSGTTQALKETTVTFEQKIVQGFLIREEWRRDFSNQPYFYTGFLDILKREQNTATVGVVWWFGAKKAPW